MEEDKSAALLFNIAVYLKGSPAEIRELQLCSIHIQSALMNTYSVALQVLLFCDSAP